MAHSGTVLGQLYECIVVYELVLGASSRDVREREQKVTHTLTRPKMLTTDSNAASNGTDARLPLTAVRVSMSAFNAAVAFEQVPTSVSMLSAARGLQNIAKRCGERCGVRRTGGWIAEHELYTRPAYLGYCRNSPRKFVGNRLHDGWRSVCTENEANQCGR